MKNVIVRRNKFYASFRIDGKLIRRVLDTTDPQEAIALAYILKRQMEGNKETIPNPKPENNPKTESTNRVSYVDGVDKFMQRQYRLENAWQIEFGRAKQTASDNMTIYKRLYEFLNVEYFDEITYEMLSGFMQTQEGKVNNNTLNKYRAMLGRLFQMAEDYDWIYKSPARKLPTYKAHKPVRYVFTNKDINNILTNGGEFRSFYEFQLETGIRCADLYGVKTGAFYSKGNGVMYYKFTPVKLKDKSGINNFTEEVEIPLSDRAGNIVKECKTEDLFPGSELRSWREACMHNLKSNFDPKFVKAKNIRHHTFRHTFAQNALDNDMKMEELQTFLGHATMAMSQVYAKHKSHEKLLEKRNLIRY